MGGTVRFDPETTSASVVRTVNERLPRLYWLITLFPRVIAASVWIWELSRRGSGSSLSQLDFGRLKTSDTVFILATGASINQFTDSKWGTIARHDSIGMNWFMLHDFIPNMYVMENMEQMHRQLLRMRSNAYANVPIILKTQVTNLSLSRVRERMTKIADNPEDIRSRFYYSIDLLVAGATTRDVYWAYKILARLGFFKTKSSFRLLTKRRGSITYIVNLAARVGYKDIVLCGVDLNHDEYFYDSMRPELESQGLPVPPHPNPGTVHPTNDPNKHPVTVRDVILALNESVLKDRGIRLFVGDRSSALHPEIPEYEWPV